MCVCFSVDIGGIEREREDVFFPVMILTLINNLTCLVDCSRLNMYLWHERLWLYSKGKVFFYEDGILLN